MSVLNPTALRDVNQAILAANVNDVSRSHSASRRGWYYDTSVFPPVIVSIETPEITDCAEGSPQDVWGNLWTSQKAREHYTACPHCQLWDRVENRW